MRRTIVINIVGLTESMIGPDTPNLSRLISQGACNQIQTITPAVTCSVQATYLTGHMPEQHGIVANGWYDRHYNETWFWKQSNKLVQSEKVWETAKEINSEFTCANMFWWYNMATSADFAVTPRPMYPADGRKIPDCYAKPPELRDFLTEKLGSFPLFDFWGPMASIRSSKWIAEASQLVWRSKNPTLMLVYLPHLDYNLQRLGPLHPKISDNVRQVDQLCGDLIQMAFDDNDQVLVLSEYAVTPVDRPIHINRELRIAGLLNIRSELGLEQLDFSNSRAFAVSDHQIAHVYVNNPVDIPIVKRLVESMEGVDLVLSSGEDKKYYAMNHARSGDLVVFAKSNAWFTYYFWTNNKSAPDYARTVDIHRKPGFDPVELFYDPAIRALPLSIGWKLLKKKLGFRQLMDVISLDATLVKGSHGIAHDTKKNSPIAISSNRNYFQDSVIHACAIKQLILDHIFTK